MSSPLFVVAVVILMAAHVVRTVRWRVLLSGCNIYVSNVRPLSALSVGYLVNTLLPFRLGEVVRSGLLSYTSRSRFSTVLGTVVVERLADLLVVGVIMLGTIMFHHAGSSIFAWTLALALSLLALFAIKSSPRLRHPIWLLASFFNEEIKAAVLHFFFVVFDLLFTRPILRSAKFWGLTVMMWGFYLSSLIMFASANGEPFFTAFSRVYMHVMDVHFPLRMNIRDIWFFVYLSLPIPLILVYAYMSGFSALAGLKGVLREVTRIEHYTGAKALGRLHGFRLDEHYHSFLDRFFCGQGGLLSEFEQRGIDDVLVHRIFYGGSGAITALVEMDGRLRVRKFASEPLATKLIVQHDWLDAHREQLPLVQVLATSSVNSDYFYDMEYTGGSRDLYEAIHSDSFERSMRLINGVVDTVSMFHESTRMENADDDVVGAYVDAKVLANFEIIEREFKDVFDLGTVDLNGDTFDLSKLKILKNRDWFISQLRDRRQSSIHGDLTIENIMVDASVEGRREWFLIDPNPVNGFQSPLIDFAKLMQSLHLGYEALHKTPRATLSDGRLRVGLHRSAQYERLHAHVVDLLRLRFGREVVRQIDLHEWINYLRLIPYQLRTSREAGLAFFGCLCMLVRDFERAYPGELTQ